jgi:RHS repeat-associated protein
VNGVRQYILWNGDEEYEIMDSSGNAVERYQQGMTIDGIEGRQLGQSSLSDRYIKDHLGSIMKVIREYGTAENEYIYDSFGNIIYQSGTLTNQRLYTSRFYDSESGLYYYRARYYDSSTGRFLSEDPIGWMGGLNYYSYVGNSPINWNDPHGLRKRCCFQTWAECYTNCIDILAPGFTEFFVGSQIAVNLPYDLVVIPGKDGRLIVREVPHAISLIYPKAWTALTTISKIVRPVQAVYFSWVAGASYGCMFRCLIDPCSY